MSFDLKAGIYVYAMDSHGGQRSRLYALMSRLGPAQFSDAALEEIRTGRAMRRSKRTGELAMRWRQKCDQCQMLSINGVPCHEIGCPNAKKRRYVAMETEEWQRAHEVYAALKARGAK
ncbi:MAG: hypothetical protein ACKVQA_21160 [Burkholderiales bacterium]